MNQIVLLAAVFAYGFLATFVMTNLSRNHREQRGHGPVLTLHGYGLMAGSFTMAALLFAYCAYLFIRG